ncbi:uncharacterized protein LTR77_011188 [Saxophila tyrrhenica]|uniref:Enoyl reductase (ER) domain-containing protein n=1 Tax=Saxophila tyrrhenica TaxID=1690608 RepID=A0AAV9NTF6_9PEZI|nr:hypothetical protein LTR77_011188 [Saxophila tyrrhenica]
MKAARFYDNHDIRIEDIDTPIPNDGEILIDVAWAGICGTDLHEYSVGPLVIPKPERPHASTGDHLPITIGHEFCGHIAQAPDGAVSADGTPLKAGMPVMCDPRLNCQSCFSCNEGSTNTCPSWGFLGLSGGGGGGFSEQVAVRQFMCYPLPEDMQLDHAVLIEPLAVARRAVKQANVPDEKIKDMSILVVGGGPVGFSVLCNLKALGATQVYVSEPTALRQKQCKGWCSRIFNPMQEKVADECRKLTDGKGVDLVFDCAGIEPGMKDGFDALRPKGTYVNVAGWEGPFTVSLLIRSSCKPANKDDKIPMQFFMMKEIDIRTSLAYDDADFAAVVKDFVAGKFAGAESMITARIGLEDVVEQGFEALVKHKDQHSKIIATPKAELLPRKRRNTGKTNGA